MTKEEFSLKCNCSEKISFRETNFLQKSFENYLGFFKFWGRTRFDMYVLHKPETDPFLAFFTSCDIISKADKKFAFRLWATFILFFFCDRNKIKKHIQSNILFIYLFFIYSFIYSVALKVVEIDVEIWIARIWQCKGNFLAVLSWILLFLQSLRPAVHKKEAKNQNQNQNQNTTKKQPKNNLKNGRFTRSTRSQKTEN